MLIGRTKEKKILNKLYESNKAQFVAIYGRRRVGKTFLVNEIFEDKFAFKHSGLSPIENDFEQSQSPTRRQLMHFYNSLILFGMKKSKCPENWMDAFLMLELLIQEKDDGNRQVVFIDELPWLDTAKSGFITAFEGFWNTWACSRKNFMLIVCGSATSWITNNLINNHGGLYNRLTCEIKLSPFNLKECEEFFKSENIPLSRYDITQAYMITGGIPYYLSYFDSELSLAQNIDNIFFNQNAPLKDEYNRLFQSIFVNDETMKAIIKALSKSHYGYTKAEISKAINFEQGGTLSNYINALVTSDFVEEYHPFAYSKKTAYYRLRDPFCFFYLKFMENHDSLDTDFWLNNITDQSIISWRGIAFENVCFNHINQIKNALGISGVSTKQSAWSKKNDETNNTQIDMLIERKDNIVNMCEIKFYSDNFTVDKTYDAVLRKRQSLLYESLPKKMAIQNILITTYGLKHNEYSGDFIKTITLNDLFNE